MATSREGRREQSELSQVTPTAPTALGGGGKNHSPPRIDPWSQGPGGPHRRRGAVKARKAGGTDPPNKVAQKKISLGFYFAKSRPGYPRVGWETENRKIDKQQNTTETSHSRIQPPQKKVHFL